VSLMTDASPSFAADAISSSAASARSARPTFGGLLLQGLDLVEQGETRPTAPARRLPLTPIVTSARNLFPCRNDREGPPCRQRRDRRVPRRTVLLAHNLEEFRPCSCFRRCVRRKARARTHRSLPHGFLRYFSPKSAIAPRSRAWRSASHRKTPSAALSTRSFTVSSIVRIRSRPDGPGVSNSRPRGGRSGSTFAAACPGRVCRGAYACVVNMLRRGCAPVGSQRAVGVDSGTHRALIAHFPLNRANNGGNRSFSFFVSSREDETLAPDRPRMPTWPPLSQ